MNGKLIYADFRILWSNSKQTLTRLIFKSFQTLVWNPTETSKSGNNT